MVLSLDLRHTYARIIALDVDRIKEVDVALTAGKICIREYSSRIAGWIVAPSLRTERNRVIALIGHRYRALGLDITSAREPYQRTSNRSTFIIKVYTTTRIDIAFCLPKSACLRSCCT